MKGIFLDTETNGLDWERHSILEIAFIVLNLGTGAHIETYASLIQINEDEFARSDPKSLEFTGITKGDLANGKTRDRVCKEIISICQSHGLKRGEATFICQNPSFDRLFFSSLISPSLQEQLSLPYTWLDLASMYFAREIARGAKPEQIGLSKDRIATHFKLPPEKRPHRALAGVEHLILCYEKVVGFPLR